MTIQITPESAMQQKTAVTQHGTKPVIPHRPAIVNVIRQIAPPIALRATITFVPTMEITAAILT